MLKNRSLSCFLNIIVLTGCLFLFYPTGLFAQNKTKVGSENVTVADPAIPRPATKPCIVKLFTKQDFGQKGKNGRMDAVPHSFRYHPPAACKGPWAKVVLEASFSVDPGYQYDRSVSLWLNGVNLYFGTTEEPSPKVGPSWQVQRDLTDYSSLFRTPGEGKAWLNNWIDSVRASIIHGSARLLFYPANSSYLAPKVPDKIIALNQTKTTPANLKSEDDQLSRNITFPRNTKRVYLDIIAEPQSRDEFYFMRNDSYREVAVSIDGMLAGLALISPWVFTGGMDPFLWRPTPGAETLNFMPYRVDLAPFAGLLSDGKQHSVSVSVLHADNFFSVSATLLIYQDENVKHTGGDVTNNTLQNISLKPTITSTMGARKKRGQNGNRLTQAKQSYTIEGFVNTSDGRVKSTVKTTISFSNMQQFINGIGHTVRQTAHVESTSHSSGGDSGNRHLHRAIDYSLNTNTSNPRKNGNRVGRSAKVEQIFERHIRQSQDGLPIYQANSLNIHFGADNVNHIPGDRHSYRDNGQTSTQIYSFSNSFGDCYRTEVQARDRKVVNMIKGQGCIDGQNSMHWFVRPDGSPDSFGWRGLIQLSNNTPGAGNK